MLSTSGFFGTPRSSGNSARVDAPPALPEVILTGEHHGRIERLLKHDIELEVELALVRAAALELEILEIGRKISSIQEEIKREEMAIESMEREVARIQQESERMKGVIAAISKEATDLGNERVALKNLLSDYEFLDGRAETLGRFLEKGRGNLRIEAFLKLLKKVGSSHCAIR